MTGYRLRRLRAGHSKPRAADKKVWILSSITVQVYHWQTDTTACSACYSTGVVTLLCDALQGKLYKADRGFSRSPPHDTVPQVLAILERAAMSTSYYCYWWFCQNRAY